MKILFQSFILFILFSIVGCSAKEEEQKKSKKVFSLIEKQQSKLDFVNTLTETPLQNVIVYQYFHNGAGVAVGDINNDGLDDIYMVANQMPNRLFLNKGSFEFEDISPKARVTGGRGWAVGATLVDINNDGYLDIYVAKSGNVPPEQRKNKLYINQGDLTFVENASSYGLDDDSYSTQGYFLDYDRDGDLDMYLLNHPITAVNLKSDSINSNLARDQYAGDKLFENRNNKFVDISEQAGISGNGLSYGLSASVGDVNGDGYPDIYVCNDYQERDYLYINQKDGTFKDELKTRTDHISNFSMGSDIADLDGDGTLDIFVADMAAKDNYRSKANMSGMNPERFNRLVEKGLHYQYMINTLQLNNGGGQFSEVSQLAGLDKTDWSWAALIADYNNDGAQDIYVTNGLRKEARNNDFINQKKELLKKMLNNPTQRGKYLKEMIESMPEQKIANFLYFSSGNLQFNQVEDSIINIPSFSNGAAYSDLDNDGDLDLIVNNIDERSFLIRNDYGGNYLKIKLEGDSKNTFGIGAKVILKYNDQTKMKEHYITRGYLSSVTPYLHFGLNNVLKVDTVYVEWTDGKQSIVTNVETNQTLTVNKQKSKQTTQPVLFPANKSLKTVLSTLDFTHKENEFDDFEREVLLPHQMSKQGPAIATADINADGLEDLYVGGAIGQAGQLFIQREKGNYSKSQNQLWEANKLKEETAVLFFDYDNDGDLDLYVGSGGNESESGSENLTDVVYQNNEGIFKKVNVLPADMKISTGVVSANDYDNDGDMDLFIGSRQLPGKYPYSDQSVLLENNNGTFINNTLSYTDKFDELGMVTDAKWTDLNANGKKELIVCGEWMPIKVFGWENEKLIDKTIDFGLDSTNGWWNSIEIADINSDGKPDVIAGNLGKNYKYKASNKEPFKVYSGDANGDGNNDIILSYNQKGSYYPLRGRECSSQQIPEIKQQFPTYDLFASSTLEDIYGEKLKELLKLEVYDFSSALFISEGNSFKRVNFDSRHQGFAWQSIQVVDLNKDGFLDVITAGNLYESEVETPRLDAGKGLILLGNGKGEFEEAKATQLNWGAGNVKELVLQKQENAVLIGVNDGELRKLSFRE